MEVRYQLRYSPAAPAYSPEQLRDPICCPAPEANRGGVWDRPLSLPDRC